MAKNCVNGMFVVVAKIFYESCHISCSGHYLMESPDTRNIDLYCILQFDVRCHRAICHKGKGLIDRGTPLFTFFTSEQRKAERERESGGIMNADLRAGSRVSESPRRAPACRRSKRGRAFPRALGLGLILLDLKGGCEFSQT